MLEFVFEVQSKFKQEVGKMAIRVNALLIAERDMECCDSSTPMQE